MQINSYLIVYHHHRLLDIGPTFTILGMAREGTVLAPMSMEIQRRAQNSIN
jgi:hypothetical protein